MVRSFTEHFLYYFCAAQALLTIYLVVVVRRLRRAVLKSWPMLIKTVIDHVNEIEDKVESDHVVD